MDKIGHYMDKIKQNGQYGQNWTIKIKMDIMDKIGKYFQQWTKFDKNGQYGQNWTLLTKLDIKDNIGQYNIFGQYKYIPSVDIA